MDFLKSIIAFIFSFIISIASIINPGIKISPTPTQTQINSPSNPSISISNNNTNKSDYQEIEIIGRTMIPTYYSHNFLSVDKKVYKTSSPLRGDVIYFVRNVDNSKTEWTKRVIGIPEEKVMISNGQIYINNQLLNEPYLLSDTYTKNFTSSKYQDGEVISIPKDGYFVLGDNRDYSTDSREWGFVYKKDIIGKVTGCIKNCEFRD